MSDLIRPVINAGGFLPAYLLAALGVIVVALDAILPAAARRKWMPALGIMGMAVILGLAMRTHGAEFGGAFLKTSFRAGDVQQMVPMIELDRLSSPGMIVIVLGGFITALLGADGIRRRTLPAGEFVGLLLLGLSGAAFFAVSRELIVMFLSIEIFSISMYVLVALDRRSSFAAEAAFKYFILGAFASAFLVFGIALLFGATGSTYFDDMKVVISSGGARDSGMLLTGFAMVLVGLGFKLALAPFHMYAPDVYEGAPAPVAALIATAAKVGGFIALARFMEVFAGADSSYVQAFLKVLWLVAALSMVIGNVAGVLQTSMKRMLAYSSVAHSGYMLLAILALFAGTARGEVKLTHDAENGLIIYLFGYTAMNLLAFGIASALGRRGEMAISDYAGLARRRPWVAAGMALAMISLTGLPPTLGFVGKYFVFASAVEAGFPGLAALAVVLSVASAYYYLRVVVAMYMNPAPEGDAMESPSVPSRLALAISAAVVVVFGIFPGLCLDSLR